MNTQNLQLPQQQQQRQQSHRHQKHNLLFKLLDKLIR